MEGRIDAAAGRGGPSPAASPGTARHAGRRATGRGPMDIWVEKRVPHFLPGKIPSMTTTRVWDGRLATWKWPGRVAWRVSGVFVGCPAFHLVKFWRDWTHHECVILYQQSTVRS